MNKIKWIALALIIIVTTPIGILLAIDPNDYRSDIEEQAMKNAGIDINIEGNIAWSLIPLGLNLNQISLLDTEQKTFTQFNNLTLQIDTLSLLKLAPQINKVLLDGFDLNLVKNRSGQGNWENLSQQSPSKQTQATDTKDTSSPETGSQGSLNFLVEEVQISNAKILYSDEQSNQSMLIDDIHLAMNNITLESPFPINLRFKLAGNALQDKTITSSLDSSLLLSPSQKRLEVSNLNIDLANLSLLTDLLIENYDSTPAISGKVSLKPFDLNALLSNLGQAEIKTTNPEAFKKVSLSSQFQLANEQLSLEQLVLQLDKSTWRGNANINTASSAIIATLNGDSIIVDDYLPPAPDAESTDQVTETNKVSDSTGAQAPLLPLDTIRGLKLDISFKQDALTSNALTFKNTDLKFTALDGVLNLEKADTELFDGTIKTTAKIDAQSDDVKWQSTLAVNDLNYLDNVDKTVVFGWELGGSGDINTTVNIQSAGNTLDALQKKAKGEINFAIDKGALTGVNFNKLACEGFALINGDKITKADWANATQFNSFEGQVKIDGLTINSPSLVLENIGLKASGTGGVNIAGQQLEYELDINPNGELGDEACRVHDKVKGIAIPILCKGSFDTAPAKLCGINKKKLGRIIEQFAKKEAKRKVEKEVDRAIEKKLDKYIDKDSGLGKALKDGLKGLF